MIYRTDAAVVLGVLDVDVERPEPLAQLVAIDGHRVLGALEREAELLPEGEPHRGQALIVCGLDPEGCLRAHGRPAWNIDGAHVRRTLVECVQRRLGRR